MPRYIDADLLCEVLEKRADDEWNKKALAGTWSDAYRDMIDTIDDEPTADVEPVRHGRWIAISNGNMKHWKECCSECGIYTRGQSPFCKNCGAKMDLEDGDEDATNR